MNKIEFLEFKSKIIEMKNLLETLSNRFVCVEERICELKGK